MQTLLQIHLRGELGHADALELQRQGREPCPGTYDRCVVDGDAGVVGRG